MTPYYLISELGAWFLQHGEQWDFICTWTIWLNLFSCFQGSAALQMTRTLSREEKRSTIICVGPSLSVCVLLLSLPSHFSLISCFGFGIPLNTIAVLSYRRKWKRLGSRETGDFGKRTNLPNEYTTFIMMPSRMRREKEDETGDARTFFLLIWLHVQRLWNFSPTKRSLFPLRKLFFERSACERSGVNFDNSILIIWQLSYISEREKYNQTEHVSQQAAQYRLCVT